jgi:hypothetical protein
MAFVSTFKSTLTHFWVFTCYCFKMASKIQNSAKFTKEQEMFAININSIKTDELGINVPIS